MTTILFIEDWLLPDWGPKSADDLYGVSRWGAGYFNVMDNGEVGVFSASEGDNRCRTSLFDIVNRLQERNIAPPFLLRFNNILEHQVSRLNRAFAKAIESQGYGNHYQGVFPIKVNQQRHVIEKLLEVGSPWHYGLEVGSKPELIAALASMAKHQPEERLIVCSGYKDAEFIDLCLTATQLGIRCFIVIETPQELNLVLERSAKMGVDPFLGVRSKISTKMSGHWNETSGDRSVFGLTASQVVHCIDQLKAADKLHCMQLLHFHLGSQIPDIRDIRNGASEALQVYVSLYREGAPMGYLNMGGGMAVDYSGLRSNTEHSMNYGMDEYAADIVETVKAVLDEHQVPHPVLVSETGRATVAYSSVLVFNILDTMQFSSVHLPERAQSDEHEMIANLWHTLEHINAQRLQEMVNDAAYYREELLKQFTQGQVSLRLRADGDQLFYAVLIKAEKLMADMPYVPEDLKQYRALLADVYYGNFSLFQSLPDAWAIDQLFPVMPIHRLAEEPKRRAVISDITCDCDGKIDQFIDHYDIAGSLAVHDIKPDEDYFIGAFLVGGYQETLGSLHNLFGDTNMVSVDIRADGSFKLNQELDGDSIADVLSYTEYDPRQLLEQFRSYVESRIDSGHIAANQRRKIIRSFQDSMSGYTYYETEIN